VRCNELGARARVLSPSSLAREIHDECDAARERYTPRLPFDPFEGVRSGRQLKMWGDADEMRLPFARRA
jgi:hypothetical protein